MLGLRPSSHNWPRVFSRKSGIGAKVEIETDGPDEAEAMQALLGLIADKFGEGQ